jgi:hypothetical protein
MSTHRVVMVLLCLLVVAAPASGQTGGLFEGRGAQRFFSRAGASRRTVAGIERSLRHHGLDPDVLRREVIEPLARSGGGAGESRGQVAALRRLARAGIFPTRRLVAHVSWSRDPGCEVERLGRMLRIIRDGGFEKLRRAPTLRALAREVGYTTYRSLADQDGRDFYSGRNGYYWSLPGLGGYADYTALLGRSRTAEEPPASASARSYMKGMAREVRGLREMLLQLRGRRGRGKVKALGTITLGAFVLNTLGNDPRLRGVELRNARVPSTLHATGPAAFEPTVASRLLSGETLRTLLRDRGNVVAVDASLSKAQVATNGEPAVHWRPFSMRGYVHFAAAINMAVTGDLEATARSVGLRPAQVQQLMATRPFRDAVAHVKQAIRVEGIQNPRPVSLVGWSSTGRPLQTYFGSRMPSRAAREIPGGAIVLALVGGENNYSGAFDDQIEARVRIGRRGAELGFGVHPDVVRNPALFERRPIGRLTEGPPRQVPATSLGDLSRSIYDASR